MCIAADSLREHCAVAACYVGPGGCTGEKSAILCQRVRGGESGLSTEPPWHVQHTWEHATAVLYSCIELEQLTQTILFSIVFSSAESSRS